MVQNNKVLTVSYGTFSCTLEGFEDSFGTMKAIAEYFRDLASDDRYFGAEPAQPDADMLAQIAQREISRRVEAHKGSNGIVLRADQSDTTVSALESRAASMASAAAPVAEEMAEPDQDLPEPEQPVVAEAPAEVAEPEPVETHRAVDFETGQLDAGDDIANDISVAEDIDVSDVVPAADSIAAKLNRIRAVVSRNEALDVDQDYEDDEDADAFLATTADELTAHLQDGDDLSDTEQDDDHLSALLGQMDADTDADAVKEDPALEAMSDAADAAAEEPAEVADQADADDLGDDYDDDDLWAEEEAWNVLAGDDLGQDVDAISDVTELADREPEASDAPFAAETGEELKPAGDTSDAAEFFNVYDGDDDDDYEDEDEELFADLADRSPPKGSEDDRSDNLLDDDADEDDADLAEAQVLKVNRADLESALAQGMVETVDDAEAESSLSAEAEADLMRELAEVEAEIDAPTGADSTETDDAIDTEDDFALSRSVDDDDEDLSRLMSAASTKMDEPENASRREAYNHLRAAVAAAKADTSIRDEAAGEQASQAFHNDLESVVRPRRPEAGGPARQNRPSDERPAPLKLVAEQRVDIEQAARGPVRPRRVEATDSDTTEAQAADADGGFAEFAREMGATELPDLLEAAAAYMSFVEGRDQFSRPQLMTKVRQVETRDFNREDGLRSFGQLLRAGKIEKISGGRFTASEQIGFKPQDRAAS